MHCTKRYQTQHSAAFSPHLSVFSICVCNSETKCNQKGGQMPTHDFGKPICYTVTLYHNNAAGMLNMSLSLTLKLVVCMLTSSNWFLIHMLWSCRGHAVVIHMLAVVLWSCYGHAHAVVMLWSCCVHASCWWQLAGINMQDNCDNTAPGPHIISSN